MSDQNVPADPFELLRRMWAPMSLPVPGMVAPIMNMADVDKRISDLRSVEHWLTLNVNMVKMSIQGLEMQKATLSALQAAQQSAVRDGGQRGAEGDPRQTPVEAWWTLLQQAQQPTPGDKKDR